MARTRRAACPFRKVALCASKGRDERPARPAGWMWQQTWGGVMREKHPWNGADTRAACPYQKVAEHLINSSTL
jgi:hypothetical protein